VPPASRRKVHLPFWPRKGAKRLREKFLCLLVAIPDVPSSGFIINWTGSGNIGLRGDADSVTRVWFTNLAGGTLKLAADISFSLA
jgi:hypothetical protein